LQTCGRSVLFVALTLASIVLTHNPHLAES
jgi:hypothetical protein